MIFSNKIYKVSSGKNLSLYNDSNQKLIFTVFKDLVEKKEIVFSPVTKCLNTPNKFGYNKVIKIDNRYNLICLDKYISIVESLI